MIYLTSKELAMVPEGTPIRVEWSGGNVGDYVLHHSLGQLYAAVPECPELDHYNPLRNIGVEKPLTRVALISVR